MVVSTSSTSTSSSIRRMIRWWSLLMTIFMVVDHHVVAATKASMTTTTTTTATTSRSNRMMIRPWTLDLSSSSSSPSSHPLSPPLHEDATPTSRRSFLSMMIRGGSDDNDNESEYEDEDEYDEEEEEEDDEDESLFDDFEAGDEDDDFEEDNTVDRMIQAFHKTPPLTKGYLTASFVATAIGYFMNANHEFPKLLVLDWPSTLKKGQIWRPLTTFFNFGPFGLGYVMTVHFVWTYMSTLERLHHHKPYDFWIMILFGMMNMAIGYPVLGVNARFLGHNLSTFLVYIWSRYHEGIEVNMFELFTTRAEMLPWFFLAQTFLLEGELPLLDFLGIVFGHVYHHCKTIGLLRAPDSLVTWYQESNAAKSIRQKYKEISTDFEV